MKPIPFSRLSSLRKPALIVFGVLVALLLFLWLALPPIIQWQAEKFVAGKTGHRLTLDRPEFNPFEWRLRLHKLELSEPDGKPLLAFDDFVVDVSAASLTRRAWVFDAIRLDGLAVTLVELPGGVLNWTPFLDALKGKEEKPETGEKGLPRIDIQSFVLAAGKLDFADRRTAPGFATHVEPLDLSLTDISTLPDDNGKFSIAAHTASGAKLALAGEAALNPLAITGSFSLEDLQLAQFAPYLAGILPAPPAGKVALSANYRVANGGKRIDADIDAIAARLAGFRLPLKQARGGEGPVVAIDSVEVKNGHFGLAKQEISVDAIQVGGGKLELPHVAHPPQFAALTLDKAQVSLAERTATLARVTLADGRVQATRGADGQIDLLEALKSLSAPTTAAAKPAASAEAPPAWRYRVDAMDVTGLGVAVSDESVQPAAEFALENITLNVSGVSEDLKAPLPLRVAFDVRAGGRFEGAGQAVPATPAVDFKFKLADLALKSAQPYLSSKTTLLLGDGKFSSQGRLTYGDKGLNYRGDFSLNDLRLTEPGTGSPLLAWKVLGSRDLTLTPALLDLGELRLTGLDTRLIIDKDKNVNFKKVIKPPPAASAPAAPVAAEPAKPKDAAPFVVNIDRLRFNKGEMDFADHSLVLPFGTRIHGLRGSIGNLSTRPGGAGQIELDGEVDDYGMARAVGQVNFSNPTDFMDLHVIFRNVEMTRLTPYTATFAGRKIDSGKLSLDLQYKIKQRQLQSENQVIMDRLVLGERVESPTAKDLPLDLAIAILQDSDGRIDLGLPVSGSLDDPEFSYGKIVWKAIANVLTKIVTAPFRALGALFGGGGEKLENIVFEPGALHLTPPEREKLVRLAGALAKRPGLVLTVGGAYAEVDRVALQDVQLRRAVLGQMGQKVSEKGDPGPLSTQQPKVQAALENLFAERVGKSDLAALKEGFRQANPGQLEESATGKVMSRLSGLLREKKTLGADEVAQLKGADFYSVLFERLRAREPVGDERLQALGKARGDGALETLRTAGVAVERLAASAPEKAADDAREVALKLALEAAKADKKPE